MTKGLGVCGRASTGARGSAGSWGCDSIPLLGPEPMRAIVRVDATWTECFYCLPDWISVFESEFGSFRDVFKFSRLACAILLQHSSYLPSCPLNQLIGPRSRTPSW